MFSEKDINLLIVGPWSTHYRKIVIEKFPNLNSVISGDTEKSIHSEDVSDINVIASFWSLKEIIPKIRNLRWFQALSAGYDHILEMGLLTKDMIFTNAAGAASIPVSEFVFGFMLALVKRFPEMLESQRQHQYIPFLPGTELWGKVLGVLGLGHVGKKVAEKGKAFGMTVIGYDKYVTEVEGVEKIYGTGHLEEVLQRSDFVVICLALNEQTRGLIKEMELQAMKKTAYLINVARAEIVNKEAFVKALQEKWIAGAAIDVVWTHLMMELSEEDELWSLRNLIISPHCAAVTEMYVPRSADIFCQNILRFMEDRPMINVITER